LTARQGCQMVYFHTKIPICVNFGVPWIGRCWYMLWPSVIFYGRLGYSITIWYILWSLYRYIYSSFGFTCQEKSGNPAARKCLHFLRYLQNIVRTSTKR
jgi:hypothetical protein